jgi:hypothetical protein
MFTQRLRVLLLFSLLSSSAAQDIKVRLLDCRTGIAYADKAVRLGFFHPQGTPEIPDLEAQTTADGAAVFHFSEKMPSRFMVFPGIGKDLYPCSTLLPIDLREVISKGIVSRCSKTVQGCRCKFGKAVAEVHSDSGELVIFTRPVTRGERVRWPIWND